MEGSCNSVLVSLLLLHCINLASNAEELLIIMKTIYSNAAGVTGQSGDVRD